MSPMWTQHPLGGLLLLQGGLAILLGVGFLPPWCAPTSWPARDGLGGLPPNLGGGGAIGGTARNLPEDSGTFRDGFGTFRNLLEPFHDLPGPLSDVPETSG